MKTIWNAGLAAAAAAFAALHGAPAQAADLNDGYRGGSIKDAPMHYGAPRGRCYVRGDVGYVLAGTPDVRWPVTDGITGDYLGDRVSNISMDDTWLVEGGVGCGFLGNWRAELTFGWRGEQKVDGEPLLWNPGGIPLEDPLHTKVQTWTLMANVYRDLFTFGKFTPYVGAGIGIARHDMEETYFTGNPFLINRIEGKSSTQFAWSLMAGTAYKISDRMDLDIGYRYIDMGNVASGHIDTGGNWNPRVRVEDIDAHEFKIGLRMHFGGERSYEPMK